MTPAWLQRIRAGEAWRAAALRLCTRCRKPIIVGLDADVCALTAKCDPTPLTQFGEAVALTQGRITYDLMSGNRRKELEPRNAEMIRRPRRHPVLAEHRCGQSLAAFAQALPERKRDLNDVPPF